MDAFLIWALLNRYPLTRVDLGISGLRFSILFCQEDVLKTSVLSITPKNVRAWGNGKNPQGNAQMTHRTAIFVLFILCEAKPSQCNAAVSLPNNRAAKPFPASAPNRLAKRSAIFSLSE